MRTTVTQLPDDREQFADAWADLVAHTTEHQSDLVLLPELPFAGWLFEAQTKDASSWQQSVDDHLGWLKRLPELNVDCVLGTLPTADLKNSGFIWQAGNGVAKPVHNKAFLPNEETCWEANWYPPASEEFQVGHYGQVGIGYLICTELWYADYARSYGMQGAHIIAVPRGTEKASVEKWIVGGRAAAISSGAYCISANRSGMSAYGTHFGGAGWLIDPDGEVLAITSNETPFVTFDIDLKRAEQAKLTYPRNTVARS